MYIILAFFEQEIKSAHGGCFPLFQHMNPKCKTSSYQVEHVVVVLLLYLSKPIISNLPDLNVRLHTGVGVELGMVMSLSMQMFQFAPHFLTTTTLTARHRFHVEDTTKVRSTVDVK
jgi:hypothetical protein